MYSEWVEIDVSEPLLSPFALFPGPTAKSVCTRLVADLARMQKAAQTVPSKFDSDEIVQLSLQILSYGLSLPFGVEYETVKECLSIYRIWINCTNPRPITSIPKPILEDPVRYTSIFLDHLYQIFVPRYVNGVRIAKCNEEQSLRQTKECHQTITFIQNALHHCDLRLVDQLWPNILKFALRSCDRVLSEPFEADDITTDHLGPRLLDALFQLWLDACFTSNFPSPNYWKTFRNRLKLWRHRPAVVDVWVKYMISLSKLLLSRLYPNKENFDLSLDIFKDSEHVSSELIQQTWFRFFHILGDPLDVLKPTFFDASPRFREFIQNQGQKRSILEVQDHPCFSLLPFVFYRQAAGINLIISIFIGLDIDCTFSMPEVRPSVEKSDTSLQVNTHPIVTPQQSAPSTILRQAFSGRDTKIPASKMQNQPKPIPPETVPTFPLANHLTYLCLKGKPVKWCNVIGGSPEISSLFQLFSDWLFSVMTSSPSNDNRDDVSIKSNSSENNSRQSLLKSSSETDLDKNIKDNVNSITAGRAEALACLCQLISNCKGHSRLPKGYFIKFYALLSKIFAQKDPILVSFGLFHGRNLFRLNLDGIEVIVPAVLDSIVFILQDCDQTCIHPSLNIHDLRKSCLSIVSSVLCLPAYFGSHAIIDVNCNTASHTFIGLRHKIMKILISSLNQMKEQENLQHTFALCVLFCEEMFRWEEICSEKEKGYHAECVQSVIHVISKRMHMWMGEPCTCVAALHTFCALALSARALDVLHCHAVVSQLCTFIEQQLSRPPTAHCRDMHSTVVCALWAIQLWIVHAPNIIDNQQVLKKVTDIIELGIAGANGPVFDKRPASQRVHDVSEQLLYVLFCRCGCMYTPSPQPLVRYVLLNGTSLAGFSKTLVDHNGSPWVVLSIRSPNLGLISCEFQIAKDDLDQEKIVPRPPGVTVRPSTVVPDMVFSQRLNSMPKCKADTLPVVEINDETKKVMDLIKKTQKDKPKFNLVNGDEELLPPKAFKEVDISRLLLEDLGFLDLKRISENCQLLNSTSEDFNGDLEKLVDSYSAKSFISVYVYYAAEGCSNKNDLLKFNSSLRKTSKPFRVFVLALGKVVDINEHSVLRNLHSSVDNLASIDGSPNTLYLDGIERSVLWCTPLQEVSFTLPSLRTNFDKSPETSSTVTPPAVPKIVKKQVSPGVPTFAVHTRSRGFSLDANILANQFKSMSHDHLHRSQEEPIKKGGLKGFFAKKVKRFAPTLSTIEQERHKKMSTSQTRLRSGSVSVLSADESSDSTIRSARSHEDIYTDSIDLSVPVRPPRSKSSSIDSTDSNSIGRGNKKGLKQPQLVIVWVENLDDSENICPETLIPPSWDAKAKRSDLTTFFIHPLKPGLIRVKIIGTWGRLGWCGPLVDGCVVSEHALPNMVKMTVLCYGRHRALEQEVLLLPHIKRRQQIQMFASKYAKKITPAETFLELLQS